MSERSGDSVSQDPAALDGDDADPTGTVALPEYPRVAFDVDRDVREDVLRSCATRVVGNFYVARAHGVEMVVDKETAYYNASNIVGGDNDMDALLEDSDVMKNVFDYVRRTFHKRPFYRVTDHDDYPLVNGVYMHPLTVGNVLGRAFSTRAHSKCRT